MTILAASLTLLDFAFLPPICLAIALVTASAHRNEVRVIARHAVRSWFVLMFGIVLFGFALSFLMEWILPS